MPVTVPEAIKAYLTERQSELSDSSLQNHRYQLKQFRQWTNDPGEIETIADLDPIDLSRFRRYRSESINENTMYNQLVVVRLLLRFAHRMGWVDETIPDSVVLPTRDGRARDSSIDPDRVGAIIDRLERYWFASLDHVLLSLLWTTGMRIGAVRALDASDVHLDDRWVDVVHRPKTDTPLKNRRDSEREVNLHGWVCDVLRAWINHRRPNETDTHSREPLISAGRGRISQSSIRRRVYTLTDCGDRTGDCDCDATRSSKCDASVSPHDIRRSSISAWLDRGHPPDLVSGKYDVSPSTIEEHYDVRSESAKRELRRQKFDM
jgi:integrase